MIMDFTPFIAEAFSTNKLIYKDIDDIYNKDKINFLKIAKSSKFYNHPIAQEGNIKQEYYFKKSLGIITALYEDHDLYDEFINLFKKGWNYAYTYAKFNKAIFLSEYINSYIKKKKGIQNTSDNELNSNILTVLILSRHFGAYIDERDDFYFTFFNSLELRLQHYKTQNRINLNHIKKEQKELIKQIKLKLKDCKKISTKIPSSYRLDLDKFDGFKIKKYKLSNDDKKFLPYEYIGDLNHLSLMGIVDNEFLTDKEVDELIYCYTQFYTESNLNFTSFLEYYYPALQIMYLYKQYNKAKRFFFDNLNEDILELVDKKDIENTRLKEENSLLNNEKKELQDYIIKLENKNKKLNQIIKDQQNYKTEIIPLRNFIFNLDNKDDYNISEDSLDYNLLKSLKAIVIGGHPQWQNKMKSYLPNCIFINPEMLNFDINILNNIDIVFIYTNYLNHGMYYKIIDKIRNDNIKLEYLKSNVNIEIVLKEIEDIMKK